MKSKVAFHPLVEADAANAAEWYERQQAGLGVAFVANTVTVSDIYRTKRCFMQFVSMTSAA